MRLSVDVVIGFGRVGGGGGGVAYRAFHNAIRQTHEIKREDFLQFIFRGVCVGRGAPMHC